MIPVVVLTCPREGSFAYLERTLAELEAERDRVDFVGYVVCDNTTSPEYPSVPDGWRWRSFSRPPGTFAGNKLAYWAALEEALRLCDGSDSAIVLEDDLAFCQNALRRMATFPIPRDCDWLAFYSPATFQGKQSFPGLWRTPTPVLGCQALKFSRKALARLVEWSSMLDFQRFTSSDQSLELARVLLGMKYAAHCPELVQHVGEDSAVERGMSLDSMRWRRAQTFSATLDAMALFSRDDLYR